MSLTGSGAAQLVRCFPCAIIVRRLDLAPSPADVFLAGGPSLGTGRRAVCWRDREGPGRAAPARLSRASNEATNLKLARAMRRPTSNRGPRALLSLECG